MRFLILIILIGFGCSYHPNPSKTLRVAFSAHPETKDPRRAGDFGSSTLVSLLYDGLTRCLADGNSKLAIADQVTISSDLTQYTFHLRKSYWSDGNPVTAKDFEISWKQILDPHFGSPCSYLLFPIKNAKNYFEGNKTADDVGIYSMDDQTLVVILEKPTPYFLSLTAFPSFLPFPSHNPEATNGPFWIEKEVFRSDIVLKKNKTFWNEKNIQIESIHIQILPCEKTALELFEQGGLDWMGGALSSIPSDAIESLSKDNKLQYFPMIATTFCSFNTTQKPFCNQNLRHAFLLATDRDEIANALQTIGGTIANRMVPPALFSGEDRNLFPSFDPILSKKYLETALSELQLSQLKPIVLSIRNHAADRKIAQILQKRWQETLGIKIELQEFDAKTHKARLHERSYEIAMTNWISQYCDPMNILERFISSLNFKNYPGFENNEYNEYIEQAQNCLDLNERTGWLLKAEEEFVSHTPLLSLYHWKTPSLCHPRLKNMQTTPTGGVIFEECYLD